MGFNNTQIEVLKKAVNEGIDAKLQEASAKDLLNNIISTTKEKLGGKDCNIDIRGMVMKGYDRIYDTEKFVKNKMSIEEVYELLEEM